MGEPRLTAIRAPLCPFPCPPHPSSPHRPLTTVLLLLILLIFFARVVIFNLFNRNLTGRVCSQNQISVSFPGRVNTQQHLGTSVVFLNIRFLCVQQKQKTQNVSGLLLQQNYPQESENVYQPQLRSKRRGYSTRHSGVMHTKGERGAVGVSEALPVRPDQLKRALAWDLGTWSRSRLNLGLPIFECLLNCGPTLKRQRDEQSACAGAHSAYVAASSLLG